MADRATFWAMPSLPDLALIVGASARLSRLVTTDKIGDRYLREPAEAWAKDAVGPDTAAEYEWRAFLVDGLGCPFCVGFWVGTGVLASYLLARRTKPTLTLWRFGAGALALNYLVGHVSARID